MTSIQTYSLRLPFLVFLGLFAWALVHPLAEATVTLEIQFEDGEIVNGSLAALVADTGRDGFLSLTNPDVSGTLLTLGASIGEGDDKIIALFRATNGAAWSGSAGFAEALPSLNYDELGISEGTPLSIYVFPTLTTPGARFILGDRYTSYRSSTAGGSGGTIPFLAPPDSGVYAISVLTAARGGSFDPSNPGAEESYASGNAGTPFQDGSDDVGNSRDSASPLGDGTSSWALSAGDLDFFEFSVTQTSIFYAALNGAALADAWVFDSEGNLLYAPGQGSFEFEMELDPGTYFIALRGRQPSSPASYSFDLEKEGVLLLTKASPDLAIGKTPVSLKGQGVISPSGAGQTYLARVRPGRKARSFFSIRNTGSVAGSFVVTAPTKSRFFIPKYFSETAGNITGSMKRGGFVSDYSAEKTKLYRIDVRQTTEGKKKRKSGRFPISSSGGDVVDAGQMRLKISTR